ncbi:polysaccharide deacetylase family protein [Anaeromicropila herbilytica]|uniref:NodB homology domain-containing protein n=1 Tax=Anaeromicropila herbilytica TaxID=2785025 RepID=A0A7R7EK02_9FIRM|nr:glycoside hydrolase [Anaeromicropila herbilytica]BCN30149.1 hypothetical protein bsdtb5_14440 [Anaeromicropila herbilytica]
MEFLLKKKERRKVIRTIFEAVILIVLFIVTFRALFVFKHYTPYDYRDKKIVTEEDNGFIAVSYLAVDRNGSPSMIRTERLEEHLKALKKNGYVTITQKDIENYYDNNKPLPKKSLFLMFEDGRKDTVIFAQKIMEKYNYIGTIFTYAEKFAEKDSKFLMPNDIKKLLKNSYWELGSNGYRLSYINVFDRNHNYLGELSSKEFVQLRNHISGEYNEYLMDFIRDENNIPKETKDEMTSRIASDYSLMKKVYTEEFGEVPGVYAIMHSNTGSFGSNEKASEVNEEWLKKIFSMNFNREGNSYNKGRNDIYDLTRVQPQAYWYTNHLLMRIAEDTKDKLNFVVGDLKKSKEWNLIKGACEYNGATIALTSKPKGNGLIRLRSDKLRDVHLTVQLLGNKLGTQAIYLRADELCKRYLSVKVQNDFLIIEENGEKIFEKNLTKLNKINNSTIQMNEAGNYLVDVTLKRDSINVEINNKKVVNDLIVSNQSSGDLYLASTASKYGYRQRNIVDDVYDGVFQDLVVYKISEENHNKIIFDNRLKGQDKVKEEVKDGWERVVNWFIKNL